MIEISDDRKARVEVSASLFFRFSIMQLFIVTARTLVQLQDTSSSAIRRSIANSGSRPVLSPSVIAVHTHKLLFFFLGID